MGRIVVALLVLLLGSTVAACGGKTAANAAGPTNTASSPATTTAGSSTIPLSPSDAPACALLVARVQRLTTALGTASELIAHSVNKQQLSQRIAIEKVQLRRSARLMAGGPIPAPLQGADRRLVLGLGAFADDFARAEKPALHGNFAAAVKAMGDRPVISVILGATKTIESACAGA